MTPEIIGHALVYPLKGTSIGIQCYDFGYKDSEGRLFWVLRGDRTYYHSVPKWALPLTGTRTKYPLASFLHDSGYIHKIWDRKTVDDMFLEALLFCGSSQHRARWYHHGVRWGGGGAWDDQDPADMFQDSKLPLYIRVQSSMAMIPLWYRKECKEFRKWAHEHKPTTNLT